MVENGVREKVGYLRKRISTERKHSIILKGQTEMCREQIAFYKTALEYYKNVLEHVKGTDEEREAAECVKNIESWVETYEKLLAKNEEDAKTNLEMQDKLEIQLKELREQKA